MARKPKPWYCKGKKAWYVTINGRQTNLGKAKKQSKKLFYELMARDEPIIRSDSVTVMFDLFLEWCQKERKKRTYELYLERLSAFARTIPDLRVHQLKPHHVQKNMSLSLPSSIKSKPLSVSKVNAARLQLHHEQQIKCHQSDLGPGFNDGEIDHR